MACVFLPYWEAERLAAPPESAPEKAMAIIASGSGGWRVTGVNACARALGVAAGEALADMRARVPEIDVREAAPAEDRAALERLARWTMAFSPFVAPWPEEEGSGLTLDIAGCTHLFGGEEGLAKRLAASLARFGLSARLAIAGSIGAAQALARYGKDAITIVSPGEDYAVLADLPVAALRLTPAISTGLQRLGLKRISDIAHLPRAPLARRFGAGLLKRLDQALDRAPESFSPLALPAECRAQAVLAEPIASRDHVLALAETLMGDLVLQLEQGSKGACGLRLQLYRVDGKVTALEIGLARPTRDIRHALKLFALKLDALAEAFDAGFGFEAARLEVPQTEILSPTQAGLAAETKDENLSLLIDCLGSRLGLANVVRAHPCDTHIPERAMRLMPAENGDAEWAGEALPRPLLMLPCAEPAEVMALLPDGPPSLFRWRGVRYSIVYAEGPERLRPEWWRGQKATRDYYVAEDEDGRRFWLYREGAYGGATPPKWFVHGVFA